jgi:hypothetical protein
LPQSPKDDGPATTDAEIFLEANDRLRISMEAMGENVTRAITELEFEDGNQWPDDLANQRKISKRPSLTINHTRTFIRRVVNNMRRQRPRIKTHPTGGGARVEDAKVIAGMVRHVETRSHASVAYDGAGESAVKIGWGYARVLSEWSAPDAWEQELKIVGIRNVFTVYDDPGCLLPTGADREWLLLSEEMTRAEYKRKYPKAKNAEWRKGGPGDDGKLWESKEKIRLAEYFRVKYTQETLYRLQSGEGIWASDVTGMENLMRDGDGKLVQRTSAKRTIQWFRLNGREVVEKMDLPGKWIPVVRCLGNVLDLNGQVRYHGMIKDLMDVNRMYNYWATCETELVALAPRSRFMAAAGQLDGHSEWNDMNQKSYKALVYNVVHTDPEDPKSPVLPPPSQLNAMEVPAAVINARQGAEHDMMALAGMPHEPGQDSPGQVVSGVALRRRQAISDIGHFQYYDNQTQFIAHIGEILVDYFPHYYSEARMQRIIGEDGVPQMIGINQPQDANGQAIPHGNPEGIAIHTIKNDLSVGEYDVVMDTGPGYETKRQENAELMVDTLRIGPLAELVAKNAPDLAFRSLEMDEIADRLMPATPEGMDKAMEQLPPEAQQIVKSMQNQLQQAQQTIQHLQMEIKYKSDIEQGWQKVEIQKAHMQATVKAHDTQTRADTDIKTQHLGDTTKRDVAEIQAGAKLIDSNQDRTHEKELAEMTAKAAEKAEKTNGAG